MIVYLDSAELQDAREAARLGVAAGVTTNPTLMARSGQSAERQLELLLDAFLEGPVFFQVEHQTIDLARKQALRVDGQAPGRVVIKLPATLDYFGLAAELHEREVRVAMTAVYTPAQAILAAQVRAEWIITYVDRAQRLHPQGATAVRDITSVLSGLPNAPQVMAASLKTRDQVVAAFQRGVQAVTLPISVLIELAHDELTERAIEEFQEAIDSR